MKNDCSFPVEERLKSKKLIKEIFDNGLVFKNYPIIFFYKPIPIEQLKTPPPSTNLQVGVSVSKRHFKSAVKRNRIKRLMREAYRLQKSELLLSKENLSPLLPRPYAVMMVFIGKHEEPLSKLEKSLSQFSNHLVETQDRTHGK